MFRHRGNFVLMNSITAIAVRREFEKMTNSVGCITMLELIETLPYWVASMPFFAVALVGYLFMAIRKLATKGGINVYK